MFPISLLPILFLIVAACAGPLSIAAQTPDQRSATVDVNDVEFVALQFQKHSESLSGMMWSLTHTYSDNSEVDKVLADLQGFFSLMQSGEPDAVKRSGAIHGIKEKFAAYTRSGDMAVRSFSASMLGIFGDKKYAPTIAAMLTADLDLKDDVRRMTESSKGQAAIALSMLGAVEYEDQVLTLLKTGNDFNRSGAITALIGLGGKKHAKAVVDVMLDKNAFAVDRLAPLNFLIQTGVALDYKKELLALLNSSFDSEQRAAIIFLFVRMDARDTAPAIAKFLNVEFLKGTAAKALAILGSKKYESAIALLLSDKSPLVRKDAALALGILKSAKYAGAVSKLLSAKEDFVRLYAAIALVMMDAKKFVPDAVSMIDQHKKKGVFLNLGDFHPFVTNKARVILNEFDTKLAVAGGKPGQ